MILIDGYFDFLNENNINIFQKKLKAANKMKAFNEHDRVKTSAIYHWFGKPKSALKILKPHCSTETDLKDMTKNQIIEYIRETHQLNFLGAYKIAKRRYNVLESENYLKKIQKLYPQAYNSLGNHFLQTFQFKKGYQCFSKYQSLLKTNTSAWFFNIISQADCLAGLKQYDKAIELVSQLDHFSKDNHILSSILYQVKGDFLLRSKKFNQALENLLISEKIFEANNIRNKDLAYCQISLAVYYSLNNRPSKSKEYLEKAKELLVGPNNSIYSIMQLAYLYKKMGIYDLSLDLIHKLYSMEFISTYSDLLDIKPPEKNNIYFINNGEVLEGRSSMPTIKNSNFVLDLITQKLNKNHEESEKLTEHQCNFLQLLIATNENGCFEGIILERLYPNSIYNGAEKDKLKKLAKRLKDKGFKIVVKDRFYFLLNIDDFFIITQS